MRLTESNIKEYDFIWLQCAFKYMPVYCFYGSFVSCAFFFHLIFAFSLCGLIWNVCGERFCSMPNVSSNFSKLLIAIYYEGYGVRRCPLATNSAMRKESERSSEKEFQHLRMIFFFSWKCKIIFQYFSWTFNDSKDSIAKPHLFIGWLVCIYIIYCQSGQIFVYIKNFDVCSDRFIYEKCCIFLQPVPLNKLSRFSVFLLISLMFSLR